MKLNFAHICERAFISEYNIPSIIGIFSKVRAASLPATRRNTGVILNFNPEDTNKHSVLLELKSPSGKKITERKIDMESADSTDGSLGFVSNFPNLALEEEGIYVFSVIMDENKDKFTELKFSVEIDKK